MAAGKDITIINIETQTELSLDELCDICHVSYEYVRELIDYGAIEPRGMSIELWRFNPHHLLKIQTIQRLQRDLEVNLAGAALAVDLMDQIKLMRAQLEFLNKHVFMGK